MTEKLFLKGLYILSKKWRACQKGDNEDFNLWEAQLNGFLAALDGIEIHRGDFFKAVCKFDSELADLENYHGELVYTSDIKTSEEIFIMLKNSNSVKLW